MSHTHASGNATARSEIISVVHSATSTSRRQAPVCPTYKPREPRKPQGAVIMLSSEDDDDEDTVTPVKAVTWGPHKIRTVSQRLDSTHILTTTQVPRVPLTQQDVRKDGIGSICIEVISGAILGAVLMWFYLAFF
ncbi:hypothetical protein F5890DRAFT_1558333 [Lentinula detonsa]|uniref:Uncharacterized protein n=1 Tax=Lentinula detonsa TaxID=2804962 RepID=A0AA38PQC5_9AGAR|nr:hypothetical protein F5890DRAFT_1558333 [Lentinula detonsa]